MNTKTSRPAALNHNCITCGARPWMPCLSTKPGESRPSEPHAARVERAERA